MPCTIATETTFISRTFSPELRKKGEGKKKRKKKIPTPDDGSERRGGVPYMEIARIGGGGGVTGGKGLRDSVFGEKLSLGLRDVVTTTTTTTTCTTCFAAAPITHTHTHTHFATTPTSLNTTPVVGGGGED